MKRNIYLSGASLLVLLLDGGCTKLNETLYSNVTSQNFFNTQNDVISDFIRPFEHCYWSIQGDNGEAFELQENTTDECMTPNRQGDWQNGGLYAREHYHTITPVDPSVNDVWGDLYTGVDLCTNTMEDLQSISDPQKFQFQQANINDMIAEVRTLRAWEYIRLLDMYRNIEIVPAVQGQTKGFPQVTPQEAFNYIETELLAALPDLPTPQSLLAETPNIPTAAAGRCTQGFAAALLVRLLLNARVYVNVDKSDSCALVCQDIISGKYGGYALETRWDAPFDYNNATSSEVIFGFPGTLNQSHWQYTGGMYYWMLPYQMPRYFGFSDFGDANPKYAMQPGRDVDSVEYSFALGKPFIKFLHYPDDLRLKIYKNLGNSTREGMFLYGYFPYTNSNGTVDSVRGDHGPYALFLRDQVGMFLGARPGTVIADKESDINHADMNSGLYPVKYPYYPTPDPNRITSSYAEVRLAEVYYSLAECKYRAGDKAGAALLLNAVRSRNYPAGSPSLYTADGSQLTDQEMIDEWGREFLMEGRRRTDLIRWGVFNSGTWWDKQPDGNTHTAIFPIGQNVLNASPQLKQNDGY